MIEASFIGVVKIVLIILGAFIVLRFLGQLMNAKRNLEDEKQFNDKQKAYETLKKVAKSKEGKVKISDKKKSSSDYQDYTDYEEIK